MTLDDVKSLIKDDFLAVDAIIRAELTSDVALINQLSNYIIDGGGKRLRPILTLLAARACGYTGADHTKLAAVIELIHTATLLHDDVVDASDLRRGRETASKLFGNEAAVLVGDFLYSRSFQMMAQVQSLSVMDIMAEATNTIAEGEVLQLMNCHDPDVDEARYLAVIERKTAKLFEAATCLGATLADATGDTRQALADYGMALGIAFQLVDDALDYSANGDELGKNLGDDLAEGKPTLPLLRAMQQASDTDAALIRTAIKTGGREKIAEVTAIIQSTDALDYTRQQAEAQARIATAKLNTLPASPFRDALEALCKLAVDRKT